MSKEPLRMFAGRLGFLSNFTNVPHGVHGYPTVEHFFVAMKTTDQEVRDQIKEEMSPGRVKRMGRKLVLRPDWDDIKMSVMEYALNIKFRTGTDLAQALMDTGDEHLCEHNGWHDNDWGDCFCNNCVDRPGLNNLGILLMKRRAVLLKGV